MSVLCVCMSPMASAPTDTVAATSGDVVAPRRRGKSKAPNFRYEGPVSVIRLELDVSDERTCVGGWSGSGRRCFGCAGRCNVTPPIAVARTGRRITSAQGDPKALRERLGLTRKGIEAAAKAHIEASGWMRDHLTKAIGLHVADEVWQTVDRHLFADASGRRHGPPRIGSWWDFTRIPGRARSHTKATPTWETYRLVGTLDGHLVAYRHPQLPAGGEHRATGGRRSRRAPRFWPSRPGCRRRRGLPVGRGADHDGALAVVFTGLPGGDLVLPVRLPQGAGQWAHLAHFLADPSVWHKIDLVRVA